MKEFGKTLGLTFCAFITVVTSAGAMNSGENFYLVCGIINLLLYGYAIYKVGQNLTDNVD